MFKRLICSLALKWCGGMGDSKDKKIVALEAEVVQLKKDLREAESDALTGLPGRRSYDREVVRMLNEVKRKGFVQRIKYGLLVIDLNGFKPINDKIGHIAGDQLLQKIAESLRGRDFVARYGGDEFVVISKVKGEDELMLLADRLCTLIRKSVIVFQDQALSTTASIGGTLVTKEDDNVTAFQRADQAMYVAKELGNPDGAYKFIKE